MEQFTPVASAIGGVLIGLSASMMLLLQGRVTGISGIVGGLLTPAAGEVAWRVAFVGGLLTGGLLLANLAPQTILGPETRSLGAVAVAGLTVGVGTRMGNGCTSGHGVCGLSRLSTRAAAATATFMATGAITAGLVRWFAGGAL
jgi:uncharacterized membrane protein YedE/YeeE